MHKLLEPIFFFVLLLPLVNSCIKDDEKIPEYSPTMTGITISGSDKIYNATLFFNDGVYKNSNKTGDLDNLSFELEINAGTAKITSYLVNHVAGQKNASFRIVLDKAPDLNEIITIQPANDDAIFNAFGYAMDVSQKKSIGLDGITHETIVIKDEGNGTGTTTFTSNNTYILDGFVFVNDGQTLTIEAGTVIKGSAGQGENASALVIARGGTLLANGSASKPIIFTSILDDLNGSVSDLDDGLWGGLIVLGHAKLNVTSREQKIEGIPVDEPRAIYGGDNDMDNSGILRYVSIRHGGTDIGDGNEINGLTLGGVGSETILEFIEVFSNKDDGVEIFGGAPRLNNIIVAFCGDDAYDYDDGFHGKGQFWVGVQGFNRGDKLGEHDGCSNDNCNGLLTNPEIYNVTYTGRFAGDERQMVTFRNSAGGKYTNSIFYQQYAGIDIEYLLSECSYDAFLNDQLQLKNNIFYNITYSPIFHVTAGSGITNEQVQSANLTLAAYFTSELNEIKDPGFIIDGLTFDIIPSNDVSTNMGSYPDDIWFSKVNYKGAFNPEGEDWTKGWSLFSKYMN